MGQMFSLQETFFFSYFMAKKIQEIIIMYSLSNNVLGKVWKKFFGCNRNFDFWYNFCPSDTFTKDCLKLHGSLE